jgi:hypothetical protein
VSEVAGETVTDMSQELKKLLEDVRKNIESKDVEDVINDAVDFLLICTPNHEIDGFDILISQGGPNVRWTYLRGACELVGNWGGSELKLPIDIEKCEEVINVFEDNAYSC